MAETKKSRVLLTYGSLDELAKIRHTFTKMGYNPLAFGIILDNETLRDFGLEEIEEGEDGALVLNDAHLFNERAQAWFLGATAGIAKALDLEAEGTGYFPQP